MKNSYLTQVIDIINQVDLVSPKKIQLFEEYRNDPANARIFFILFRHRQIEMILDGNEIIEVKSNLRK